jgi:hypothetical protein
MHAISRRGLFRLAAVVGAAVALPVELTQSAGATAASSVKLTRANFARYVGTTMRMTGSGFSGNVVLSSVDNIAAAPANDANRFTVLFKTTASSTTAVQGIYTFRQSSFGSVDLFVVPVDRGVNARYYQAVINRPS